MVLLGKFFGWLRKIKRNLFRPRLQGYDKSLVEATSLTKSPVKGTIIPLLDAGGIFVDGYGTVKIIPDGKRFRISVNGMEYSLFQFAKKYDFKFSTIYNRIKKGNDIKNVLAKPPIIKRDYKKNPPCTPKLWEWKGEKHSVAEWARIYGVKKEMMRRRLRDYGSPEQNTQKLDAYQATRAKKYEWNGESHSIREWAHILNVPERTMYGRIKKYGTPQIFKKPAEYEESEDTRYGYDGEWKTIAEWAEETGLPEEQVKHNFSLYGEPNRPEFFQEEELSIDDEEDQAIENLITAYTSKQPKKESIKELLERIKNEPDDGRPLKDILGLPRAQEQKTPSEATCTTEKILI